MRHALVLSAALIALAVPGAARAQEPSFGFRAGLNLADFAITGDDVPDEVDSKTRAGFVGGIFATIPISGVVGFQPEALYSMQGTRFSEDGMTVTLEVDYFQVPLLGRFALGSGSPVALLAGPTLGIRTHAKVSAPGVPAEASEEFADALERFDAGLVAGLAVDVGRFVLDGRYTWGLTNTARESGDGSAKNRVWSFTAGMRF